MFQIFTKFTSTIKKKFKSKFFCRVLRRLVLLISNTAQLEANCEASRRQAESASRTAEVNHHFRFEWHIWQMKLCEKTETVSQPNITFVYRAILTLDISPLWLCCYKARRGNKRILGKSRLRFRCLAFLHQLFTSYKNKTFILLIFFSNWWAATMKAETPLIVKRLRVWKLKWMNWNRN